MPGRYPLVGVAEPEEGRLAKARTDDLQANGQPGAGEATGQREGRLAGHIEWEGAAKIALATISPPARSGVSDSSASGAGSAIVGVSRTSTCSISASVSVVKARRAC